MEEFKTVLKFNSPMSAEITAGMLRENGIPAQVFGQTSSYPCINEAMNNVEVKVRAEDYEEAMKLIEQVERNDNPQP